MIICYKDTLFVVRVEVIVVIKSAIICMSRSMDHDLVHTFLVRSEGIENIASNYCIIAWYIVWWSCARAIIIGPVRKLNLDVIIVKDVIHDLIII